MQKMITVSNIIIYLLIINIFTFLAMAVDKWKAKQGKWRIKERTLLILVILGGGIGGILGMKIFRHKTRKPQFYIGFPTILIFQIVTIILYFTILK